MLPRAGPSRRNRSLMSELVNRETRAARPPSKFYHEEFSVTETGAYPVGEEETCGLPFTVTWSSSNLLDGRILATCDEEGLVTLVDTEHLRGIKGRNAVAWKAHDNAVFDMCWSSDDKYIVTASGDCTARVWEVDTCKYFSTFRGHTGTVKCVRGKQSDSNVYATGSRDGNAMLWDLRTTKATQTISGSMHEVQKPTSYFRNIHTYATPGDKQRRQISRQNSGGAVSDSRHGVTSLAWMQDDCVLATSGSLDGTVKLWDVRKLSSSTSICSPLLTLTHMSLKGRRYGLTSLSLSGDGTKLLASCTNSGLYMYSTLAPDRGPICVFSGHRGDSFYVKACINFDGSYVASGSTDGRLLVWDVNSPSQPIEGIGHTNEVTGVAWSRADPKQVSTCSEDGMVRIWRIKSTLVRPSLRSQQSTEVKTNVGAGDQRPSFLTELNVDVNVLSGNPSGLENSSSTKEPRMCSIKDFFQPQPAQGGSTSRGVKRHFGSTGQQERDTATKTTRL